MRRWAGYWRLAVAGALLAGLLAWAATAFSPHAVADVEQGRLDVPTPWLVPGRTVSQTFRTRQPNLQAIGLHLVLSDPERPAGAGAGLSLRLDRVDRSDVPPVTARADLSGLRHNDTVWLTFGPIADSAGATYRATLQAEGPVAVALWSSLGESLAPGELSVDGSAQTGDLAFRTQSAYTFREGLGDLARLAGPGAALLPGLLAVLVVPGWALDALLASNRREDPWVRGATMAALSVAFWALVALWAGTLGVNAGGTAAWAILGLLVAAAVWRTARRGRQAAARVAHWRASSVDLAMAVVLVGAAAGRALNVRGLVAPAWVDSVHHTVITRLIVENGGVPASYLPYMPVDNLHYHFGFHATAAALTAFTRLDPARAVLVAGQALSALAPLAAYALAAWLTRRRWAGVGAALVTASLSYLPAYYASWGRYTHLAGLVMLPAACIAAERSLRAGGRRYLPVAILLAAGLGLTHYRALLLYVLAWPILIGGRLLAGRVSWGRLSRMAGRAVAVAAAALLIIAPWVGRLVARVLPALGSIYGGWQATELSTNTLSTGLVTAYWGKELLIAAGLGLAVGLARRRWRLVGLAAWVGIWFLAANLRLLGLHDVWLLDNEAVLISLWLPVSVLCGSLAAEAVALLRGDGLRRWRAGVPVVATVVLVLAGTWNHLDLVNPATVLVTEDDVAAYAWVRENTPPEALFLINGRTWLGDLVVGSDGGYWLPMLADRRTTLPCVLYHHGTPEYRESITGLVRAVEEAPSVDDPALLARLQEEGVTHVYVGARGGRLLPRDLAASPHYRVLYSSGPVRVYALVP